MSSNDSANQFFPPILKRLSLGFFSLILIGIAVIAYNSPQSLFQKEQDTKSTNTPIPQSTIAPPKGETLAQSTTTTPTPSPGTLPSTQSAIGSEQETDNYTPGPQNTEPPHPVNSNPESQTTDKCPGNSEPIIKGVIIGGIKYYFKKGYSQRYSTVSELHPVVEWFCNEADAKNAGWIFKQN